MSDPTAQNHPADPPSSAAQPPAAPHADPTQPPAWLHVTDAEREEWLAGVQRPRQCGCESCTAIPAGLDLDAIAARNAHRRCHHCDMPLDDDQRCPNCGSETPDDIGALVAEVRRLVDQHGQVAGELVDAAMTMWHLEPGDRSDMPLRQRITTLVAELRAERDRLAAEQDRLAELVTELRTEVETERANATEWLRQAVEAAHVEFAADEIRRNGAADALAYAAQWIRKVFAGIDPEVGRVLDAMEYSVRSGGRTIPTTEEADRG